jgi:Mrp family chromosome partitioning ATPase/capsular polysaccharide biosynthesis protein
VLDEQAGVPHAGKTSHSSKEIRAFLSHLSVQRIGLTYLIDVSYSSNDPEKASKIANEIARNYIAEEVEARMKLTEVANTWLKERIKQLAPEVRELEEKTHEYRAKNRLVLFGGQSISERTVIDYVQQLNLARAALAEAEARLALDRVRSAASLQSQDNYETARTKVALMERGLDALTNELVKRKALAIQLGELEREEAAANELFESLLKRQKETEVQQNLETINARIVEEALPPPRPSWPKKSMLLSVFGAAGAFIGVVAVLFQTLMRDAAYSRRDVERYVGLPCDYSIPVIDKVSNERPINGDTLGAKFSGARVYAVVHRQTAFGKQFRSLAQKITLDRQRPCTIVAVISPYDGDGKSVIASNLAFTAAAMGNVVLLLDLANEAPSAQKHLKAKRNKADGDDTPVEAGALTTLQNDGIRVDYCRWPVEQSSTMLLVESEVLSFIAKVRNSYNLVVVDTPSLQESTDAVGLVQRSDTTLVVVSRGSTPLRDARSTITLWDLLERTNIIMVLNRSPE